MLAFTVQDSRTFESFTFKGTSLPYAVHLPDDFDTKKSYPVLIGPGDGTQGSDKSFFWNVDNTGKYGWILVEFKYWREPSEKVKALMDHLRTTYQVEGNKFHMLGFSSSSGDSFNHTLALPQYFHSTVGIPGHPRTKNETELRKLQGVHVLNMVGENDGYWTSSARDFEKRYNKLGIESTLEIVPNQTHVLRVMVGDGFMQRMEKMR